MAQPVTVEFVGAPAAGKSTLASAVATNLTQAGYDVREPTATIASQGRARRIASKLQYSLERILRHPRSTITDLRDILATNQQTVRDFLGVGFNWQYVCGLRSHQTGDIRLLDQSVLQALWSIGYRAQTSWKHTFETVGLPPNYQSDIVVAVTASADTLESRLGNREANPSRVNTDRAAIERSLAGIDHLLTFLGVEFDSAAEQTDHVTKGSAHLDNDTAPASIPILLIETDDVEPATLATTVSEYIVENHG